MQYLENTKKIATVPHHDVVSVETVSNEKSVDFDDHKYLKGIFEQADINNDGKVSFNDLLALLVNADPRSIQALFVRFKSDTSDHLDFAAFSKLYTELNRSYEEECRSRSDTGEKVNQSSDECVGSSKSFYELASQEESEEDEDISGDIKSEKQKLYSYLEQLKTKASLEVSKSKNEYFIIY